MSGFVMSVHHANAADLGAALRRQKLDLEKRVEALEALALDLLAAAAREGHKAEENALRKYADAWRGKG
jgi:hypothetical protein